MKLFLFVILFLICAIISGAAQASTYNSHVRALYSDELITEIVKQQKNKHLTIHIQGRCINNCAIDGPTDAIEISDSRQGYIALPPSKKAMEKYTGR